MEFGQFFPWLLIGSLGLLAGASLTSLTIGRDSRLRSAWILAAALFLVAVACAMGLFVGYEHGGSLISWTVAWLNAGEEAKSFFIGLSEDPFALCAILAISLIALGFTLSWDIYGDEPSAHRVHAATGFGVVSAAIGWLSVTPVTGFFALGCAASAGFILLGTRSGTSDAEADFAVRYFFERSLGLLIGITGVLVLTWSGIDLRWRGANVFMLAQAPFLGAGLLALGLYLFLRPFPLLGWTVMRTRGGSIPRLLVAEVLPALTAFSILFRLEPVLRGLEILPLFGWVPLAGALLTLLSGLFQKELSKALSCWASAGFCLSIAALAFVGPAAAYSIAVGLSLSIAAHLLATGELKWGGEQEPGKDGAPSTAMQVSSLVAVAASSGFLGFLGGGGFFLLVAASVDSPALMAVVGLTYLMFVFFAWRVAFWSRYKDRARQVGLRALLIPSALILASFSIFWTGSLSGNVVPSSSDRVMFSALDWASREAFGRPMATPPQSAEHLSYWIYGSALLIGLIVAFWSGRWWGRLMESAPRFTRFVSGGYGVDRVFALMGGGIRRFGFRSEEALTGRLWGELIQRAAGGLERMAAAFVRADGRVSEALNHAVSRGVAVPAKVLQLIQNGDFQWYLFFAMSCGTAILIHFLRIRG